MIRQSLHVCVMRHGLVLQGKLSVCALLAAFPGRQEGMAAEFDGGLGRPPRGKLDSRITQVCPSGCFLLVLTVLTVYHRLFSRGARKGKGRTYG